MLVRNNNISLRAGAVAGALVILAVAVFVAEAQRNGLDANTAAVTRSSSIRNSNNKKKATAPVEPAPSGCTSKRCLRRFERLQKHLAKQQGELAKLGVGGAAGNPVPIDQLTGKAAKKASRRARRVEKARKKFEAATEPPPPPPPAAAAAAAAPADIPVAAAETPSAVIEPAALLPRPAVIASAAKPPVQAPVVAAAAAAPIEPVGQNADPLSPAEPTTISPFADMQSLFDAIAAQAAPLQPAP